MVGQACLPGGACCPRTPDCTLYSGVHVCWSGHSGSLFVCECVSLSYGLGTMAAIASENGSYYKRNEFAPFGSKFFI